MQNPRSHAGMSAALLAFVGSLVGGLLLILIFGDGFEIAPSGIIGYVLGAVTMLVVWLVVRGSKRRG